MKISKKLADFLELEKNLVNAYNLDSLFSKGISSLSVNDYMTLCDLVIEKIPNYMSYLTYLPWYFFKDSEIKEISIPKNIKSLKYQSLAYCKNLEKITLTDQTSSINRATFWGSTNIKDIYYDGNTASFDFILHDLVDSLNEEAPPEIHFIGERNENN